jgi:hypothetical protein
MQWGLDFGYTRLHHPTVQNRKSLELAALVCISGWRRDVQRNTESKVRCSDAKLLNRLFCSFCLLLSLSRARLLARRCWRTRQLSTVCVIIRWTYREHFLTSFIFRMPVCVHVHVVCNDLCACTYTSTPRHILTHTLITLFLYKLHNN